MSNANWSVDELDHPSSSLVCVDPEKVSSVWPHVKSLLRKACLRTALNAFEDIESDVLSGRSLLWLAWNGRVILAAAATTMIKTEAGRVCVIAACGGANMKRWLPLLGEIEAYARSEGCARMRIFGRKGWLRVLDGYHEGHVIIDKELVSSTLEGRSEARDASGNR